jgi:serine O-acetyltransferase
VAQFPLKTADSAMARMVSAAFSAHHFPGMNRQASDSMMRPEKIWWLACRAYQRGIPVVPGLLKTFNYFMFRCITPYQAKIERDLNLDHFGLGFVSHPNVEIGSGVRIYHQVTLAAESVVGSENKIFIGDDVTIGVGATVIARSNTSLYIGSGARIGAGAVVTGDVPAMAVMVGVPARLIKMRDAVEVAS